MPKERRPRTRRNANEDASKPKKAPNAYILVQNEVGASTSVRERHGANWTREIRKMWHGMSESEKDPFYHEAAARKETFAWDKQDARRIPTQFYGYQPHPGNESADMEASQPTYSNLNWEPGPKVPANIPKESHKDFMEKYRVIKRCELRAPSSDDVQGYIDSEIPSQGGPAEPVVASSLILSQAEETHHTSDSHASHGYSSSLYLPRLRVPSASPTPTLEDSLPGRRSPSTTVPTPASDFLELRLPGDQNAWMPESSHHPQSYGSQTSQQYPSNAGIAESFSSVVSQSTAPSWNAALGPTFGIQKSLQPAGIGQAVDLFLSNAVHRVYSQTQLNQDDFPLEDGRFTYFVGEQNVGGLESRNGAPFSLDTVLPHTGHGFYDQTQLNQDPFLAGDEGSRNAIGGHPVGEVVSGDGASFSDFNVGDAFSLFSDYQISDQTQLSHT